MQLSTGSATRVIHAVDPAHPATADLDALRARVAPLELVVRYGRPGPVIAAEAIAFDADLVVLGPCREMHEPTGAWDRPVWVRVIDDARSPVLVVRKRGLRRLLLGADDSPAARVAVDRLATWPLFGDVDVRAVSVATVKHPWHRRTAPGSYPEAISDYRRDLRANEERHAVIARDAASQLESAGRHTEWAVATGDPALSLLRVASAWQADVVAIGAGQTPSSVTSIGDVERQVIAGSRASVLLFPPALRPRRARANSHSDAVNAQEVTASAANI
jgi:nucleotide-binding universal stress UspA family protein